jgi:hypothetical protein
MLIIKLLQIMVGIFSQLCTLPIESLFYKLLLCMIGVVSYPVTVDVVFKI